MERILVERSLMACHMDLTRLGGVPCVYCRTEDCFMVAVIHEGEKKNCEVSFSRFLVQLSIKLKFVCGSYTVSCFFEASHNLWRTVSFDCAASHFRSLM